MCKVRIILILAVVLALAAFAPTVDAALLSCDMGNSAITGWTTSDLNAVTSGGSWTQNGTSTPRDLVSDGGNPADVGLLWDNMDGGDYIQVDMNSAVDFSSSTVSASWQMAPRRTGNKEIFVQGFDSDSTEVFRARWNLKDKYFWVGSDAGTTQSSNAYDGYFLNNWDPNEMLGISVEMSGTGLTFDLGGTETINRPAGGSNLKSIRFSSTGSDDPRGYWLDDIEVVPEPASFALLGIFGLLYLLRRRLNG